MSEGQEERVTAGVDAPKPKQKRNKKKVGSNPAIVGLMGGKKRPMVFGLMAEIFGKETVVSHVLSCHLANALEKNEGVKDASKSAAGIGMSIGAYRQTAQNCLIATRRKVSGKSKSERWFYRLATEGYKIGVRWLKERGRKPKDDSAADHFPVYSKEADRRSVLEDVRKLMIPSEEVPFSNLVEDLLKHRGLERNRSTRHKMACMLIRLRENCYILRSSKDTASRPFVKLNAPKVKAYLDGEGETKEAVRRPPVEPASIEGLLAIPGFTLSLAKTSGVEEAELRTAIEIVQLESAISKRIILIRVDNRRVALDLAKTLLHAMKQ